MDTIANARATAHELRCSRRGQNLLAPARFASVAKLHLINAVVVQVLFNVP